MGVQWAQLFMVKCINLESTLINQLRNQDTKNDTQGSCCYQVFKDNDDQITRHLNDIVHNQQVYKTVPFDIGAEVRILEKKEKFDRGKQKISKELYTIDKREGYKLIIKDEKRKLKPSISNPILQT